MISLLSLIPLVDRRDRMDTVSAHHLNVTYVEGSLLPDILRLLVKHLVFSDYMVSTQG